MANDRTDANLPDATTKLADVIDKRKFSQYCS